jgi:hypothetical protein
MPETVGPCEHNTFEFDPTVRDIVGVGTFVEVRVRCSECQELFHWRGIDMGLPSISGPTVSADGYVLIAPIAAGPGAVVGLFKAVGLEDKLVKPA